MRPVAAAVTVALAVATAPAAGADPGTVTVPGSAVLCHAPAGTVAGDRVSCAILPASLDDFVPAGVPLSETWWPPAEDAQPRATWQCAVPPIGSLLTCEY